MARKKEAAPVTDEADAEKAAVEELGESADAGEIVEEEAETGADDDVATPRNLHGRIERAVRELQGAPQQVHFALHTVEMLTGRLRLALPNAINASTDESLKADLQTLLALL